MFTVYMQEAKCGGVFNTHPLRCVDWLQSGQQVEPSAATSLGPGKGCCQLLHASIAQLLARDTTHDVIPSSRLPDNFCVSPDMFGAAQINPLT